MFSFIGVAVVIASLHKNRNPNKTGALILYLSKPETFEL